MTGASITTDSRRKRSEKLAGECQQRARHDSIATSRSATYAAHDLEQICGNLRFLAALVRWCGSVSARVYSSVKIFGGSASWVRIPPPRPVRPVIGRARPPCRPSLGYASLRARPRGSLAGFLRESKGLRQSDPRALLVRPLQHRYGVSPDGPGTPATYPVRNRLKSAMRTAPFPSMSVPTPRSAVAV